jgi:hypothetical protein
MLSKVRIYIIDHVKHNNNIFIILNKGFVRFVNKTLKFPLSYFKNNDFLSQDKWNLPYNYNHYYVEAILVSRYADERDNVNGFVIEVPSLNKQRFQVTPACLLKYEKYNFNNFKLLNLEQSMNP